MFIQTWNKYLPIIKILMKRSVNGDQVLDMNTTDFQRAAGGRKVKYTFSFSLLKGRPQLTSTISPLAKELITVLQEDDMTRKLIRAQDFEFSMNNSFQLHIKNSTPPAPEGEASSETETESNMTSPTEVKGKPAE